MFKNILLPLDGSTLSEASLGAASLLAERLHSPVTLLHVIEQGAPSQVHEERHLTQPEEAETYLRQVAARAFPADVKVQTHVHTAPVADVARSIVEHAANEFQPDLIVTSTHGRSGVRDLLFGSIAQQIVAQGTTPLLLIKPEGRPFRMQTILLPLDPDSFHDDSLAVGESLAKSFKSRLELLSVIPTYGTLAGEQALASSLMPAATQAVLDLREQNARAHLGEHVEAIKQAGVAASAIVARGDPASTIVKTAEQLPADLIILSTHRKAGIGAFWARSVAPKVAQLTRTPLLLIPLPEKQ
jgi:nucleotide-binding universal stress UspA family protein